MTKHPQQDKIPIFFPSKMGETQLGCTDEEGFHLVFCKLYIYDCLQNKKCFFKGLGKVWIPPKDGNELADQQVQFYPSPNTSPRNDGDDETFNEPCVQQVDSFYGGQLRNRFTELRTFNEANTNESQSQMQSQTYNAENANRQHFITEKNPNIGFQDVMNIEIGTVSPSWSLAQSLINGENNTPFDNCQDSFVDHMEVDNYLKPQEEDDTTLLSLGNMYENNGTNTVTNKLDYEMLLPHSVVESNSYLNLQSDQNSQDQISYCGFFENCEDVEDHISIVNEDIDKKDNFEDYYYKDSNTYEDEEDDPYSITDISNMSSTNNSKKDKTHQFSKGTDVKCNICGRKCRSINALNHHMLVHSEDRPYVCDICKKGASFKEQPTLRRHMCTHMDKQHQCDICEKYFVEKSSLRRHINTIHADFKPGSPSVPTSPNKQYCCSKCGKIFKSISKHNMHHMMHGNPNYECGMCGKVYAGKSHLTIHQRIHTGEKPFVCTICDMKFAFKHVLKSHQARIHQKIHKFKCNLCSLSFIKKSDLSLHASCHITNLKKSKRCYGSRKNAKKCNGMQDNAKKDGSLIMQQQQQQQQQQLHLKPRVKFNFDAPRSPISGLFGQLIDALPENNDKSVDSEDIDCESVNSSDSEDNRNNSKSPKSGTIDQGKKNKECLECCKAFERMGDLKRHIISHIVENIIKKAREQNHSVPVYECGICKNVIFKQVDKFKKHLREHAKLTLYQCNVCDRAFGDSSNFSKHKKVHGISYLKCTICTRKFNTKRMMIRHMEYHRHNKPKSCTYCKKLFHFESNLRKHTKIAHLGKGKMTYKCEECGARFTSVKLKWEHQWEAHGMRKVDADCCICNAKFRKVSLLRAHVIKEHALQL